MDNEKATFNLKVRHERRESYLSFNISFLPSLLRHPATARDPQIFFCNLVFASHLNSHLLHCMLRLNSISGNQGVDSILIESDEERALTDSAQVLLPFANIFHALPPYEDRAHLIWVENERRWVVGLPIHFLGFDFSSNGLVQR